MKHIELRRRLLIPSHGEELEHGSFDNTDRPSFSKIESDLLKKDDEPVGILSVLMTLVTMVTYTVDIASSTVVCYWLFDAGRWWWWMTVTPLVISLLIVNTFSIRWYIHDRQEEKAHLPEVSPGHWIMRGLFHVILLGPLIRYAELFLYGLHTCDLKEPKRHQYRLMFLQEDKDVSLLALVGSFVKSAPQIILHTYILIQNRIPVDLPTTRIEIVNVVATLVELSLAQSAFRRASRRMSPLKLNMTKIGTAVQFLSHCGVIASRVLTLAAFATVYSHWLFVFCGVHWFLMSLWLAAMQTSVCATASGRPRRVEELIFNFVIGVIYVFCFVNVKDEPTRWKYTTYYILIWIENLVLIVLWYIRADPDLWFRVPLLVTVILSLAVGLVFLVIYYQFLHPNKLWKKLQES